MKKMKDRSRIIVLILFAAIIAIVGVTSFLAQDRTTSRGEAAFAGDTDISLEGYCRDGYYNIPGEKTCSRAPNCGGLNYDQVAGKGAPDAQSCMAQTVEGKAGTSGCEGYVPVCCYEVARTGDFTKCVGHWERLWCPQSLCDAARARGANEGQCGGDCKCAHANNNYCGGNGAVVPLAQRLGMQQPPTNTPVPQQPTSQPAQPTTPQQPTAPQQPPNSGATWTPVPTWTPAPTWTQAPFNPLNIFNPPPTQVVQQPGSNVQPPANNAPTTTSNNNVNPPQNTQQQPTSAPIEIKSPKELAQEVINPETVTKLSESTDKALAAPKKGFTTVKSYDQKLEKAVENWWMKVWMYVNGFINNQ